MLTRLRLLWGSPSSISVVERKMNPRSRRSRFRLSWSRRRVSAPRNPAERSARRFCVPDLRRVVQRLRFSIRKSFRALSKHTCYAMLWWKKGFLGILRYIQAGVSFDNVEGQGLYCSRPPGSNAYVSAPVCGFLLQLFLFLCLLNDSNTCLYNVSGQGQWFVSLEDMA